MKKEITKIVKWFFKLINKEESEKQQEALVQFIQFGIVGVSNTLISYGINVLVLLILQPYKVTWDYFAGNVISFILSVLWSFYWNNRFVFIAKEGEKRVIWKALLKTYLCYGFTGLILANVLSWLWVSVLGISKFVAPFINLIISVPLNFILNKMWAFGDK